MDWSISQIQYHATDGPVMHGAHVSAATLLTLFPCFTLNKNKNPIPHNQYITGDDLVTSGSRASTAMILI